MRGCSDRWRWRQLDSFCQVLPISSPPYRYHIVEARTIQVQWDMHWTHGIPCRDLPSRGGKNRFLREHWNLPEAGTSRHYQS